MNEAKGLSLAAQEIKGATENGAHARGRGFSITTYTGRHCPEFQTFALQHANFYQNGTPFIYLKQNCTPILHLKLRVIQNNRISYDRQAFPGLSVVLVQLLKGCKLFCVPCYHVCTNLAPFQIICFSHHFFHFATDSVTLKWQFSLPLSILRA